MNNQAPAPVLSVSAVNQLARQAIERALPLLWVKGEISNLTRASSGHLYFTLKDDSAQVRCTMWRSRVQALAMRPQNGMQVEVNALATLYEVRGDYQLSVERLRPAGIGSLFEAFNRLRQQLEREGLFDEARKRPLPRLPRTLALITSAQAAALHDVLAVLRRRAPHLRLILYPAPVQGAEAATRLRAALELANARAARDGCELILLVRGGGSLEDLWSFNDEGLARAIAASALPVLSGIGHETDLSIADLAADLRAPTPSAAAELASAGWEAVGHRLGQLGPELQRSMQRRLAAAAQRVDRAALQLVHPRTRLAQATERLQHSRQRLQHALRHQLERRQVHQQGLTARLRQLRPQHTLHHQHQHELARRLGRASALLLQRQRQRLQALQAALQHLAPEAVLNRGYAIVRDADGRIVERAEQVAIGDRLALQLAHGQLEATVNACTAAPAAEPGADSPS